MDTSSSFSWALQAACLMYLNIVWKELRSLCCYWCRRWSERKRQQDLRGWVVLYVCIRHPKITCFVLWNIRWWVSNTILPLLIDYNFMSIPDTANALTPSQNDLSCPDNHCSISQTQVMCKWYNTQLVFVWQSINHVSQV